MIHDTLQSLSRRILNYKFLFTDDSKNTNNNTDCDFIHKNNQIACPLLLKPIDRILYSRNCPYINLRLP